MHLTYVGAASPTIYGTIANADLPTWIKDAGGASFCVRGWCRRGSGAGTAFRALCIMGNLFHIQGSSGVGAGMRLYVHNDGASAFAAANLAPDNGDWIYFAASYDVSTHAMIICARSENTAGGGVSDRTTGTQTFVPGAHARTPGDLTWGKNKTTGEGGGAGTAVSWDGEIEMLVIENDSKSQAELEAMVDAAFTDLAGQTGKKNPVLPLTYTGTGFAGPHSGGKWIMPTGVAVQTPTGGTGGSRIGATATSANYVWWNGEKSDGMGGFIPLASNADVEAVLQTYSTVTIAGTPTYGFDSAFFGDVPPGITTNGNNGVACTAFARLRDGTPRTGGGVKRYLGNANSRMVRITAYAGGPSFWGIWGGNWLYALVAHRIAECAGMFNVPVILTTVRRPFFDFTANPAQSGSFDAITSGTYADVSRAWTNSLIEASPGPGTGVRLRAGASLTQPVTFDPASLLDGSTPIRWLLHVLAYPGAPDSVPWEIEDASTVNGSGVDVAAGTATGYDTTAVSYTYETDTDSYSAGTPSLTLALPSGDQTAIADMLDALDPDDYRSLVVYVLSGTGAGSMAEIEAITPGATATLALRHPLNATPGDGAAFRIGYAHDKPIEITAPVPTNVIQRPRVTDSGSGGTIWLASDVEAVGVDGFSFGSSGHGAHGAGPQLADAFSGVHRDIGRACEVYAVLGCPGTQNSTSANREELCREFGVPDYRIILIADPAHRIVDNTTSGWAEDSLAQTDLCAVVATESGLSLIASYGQGETQNNTHPAIERYYRMWLAIFEEGADIEFDAFPEATTGTPAGAAIRAGRLGGGRLAGSMHDAG